MKIGCWEVPKPTDPSLLWPAEWKVPAPLASIPLENNTWVDMLMRQKNIKQRQRFIWNFRGIFFSKKFFLLTPAFRWNYLFFAPSSLYWIFFSNNLILNTGTHCWVSCSCPIANLCDIGWPALLAWTILLLILTSWSSLWTFLWRMI